MTRYNSGGYYWLAFVIFFINSILVSSFCTADDLPHTLFIVSSDQHTSLSQADYAIKQFDEIIREFKSRQPNGKCVYLFNGDVVGVGSTLDPQEKGFTIIKLIAALSQECEIVYNLGNHDALDYFNKLLILHAKYLRKMLAKNGQKNFSILNANLIKTQRAKEWIKPYQDIRTPSGKVIRVIGGVRENFFTQSNYKVIKPTLKRDKNGNITKRLFTTEQKKNHLFIGTTPLFEAYARELQIANENGVDEVIIAAHLGYEPLRELRKKLVEFHAQSKFSFKMRLYIAGDDHKSIIEDPDETYGWLVDAGFAWQFSAFEISDKEAPVSSFTPIIGRNKTESRQSHLSSDGESEFLPSTQEALTIIEEQKKREIKIRKDLPVINTTTTPLSTVKDSLKSGPHGFGQLLAQILAQHVQRLISQDSDWMSSLASPSQCFPENLKITGVVGMFNTATYRMELPYHLKEENRTYTIYDDFIQRAFPFSDCPVGAMLVTGRDLKIFYRKIREHRLKEKKYYSPHLSPNLRTNDNRERPELEILHYFDPQILTYRHIKDDEFFVLATDHVLANNNYRIKELNDITTKQRIYPHGIKSQNGDDVLRDGLRRLHSRANESHLTEEAGSLVDQFPFYELLLNQEPESHWTPQKPTVIDDVVHEDAQSRYYHHGTTQLCPIKIAAMATD